MKCMRFSRYIFGPAVLAVAVSAAAPDPKSVERGRELFQQACGFCHGSDATGARGPDLVRSAMVSHDEDGKLIGPVIKNGREEKGMPAFPYMSAQISDLAGFLHAQTLVALNRPGGIRAWSEEGSLIPAIPHGIRRSSSAPRRCQSDRLS